MYKHILIPTDGSATSNRAVRAAIALAAELGAKVTAYCALECLQPLYVEGFATERPMMNDLQRRADLAPLGRR